MPPPNPNQPPKPAYFPTSSLSPLHPPTALYTRLASLLPPSSSPSSSSPGSHPHLTLTYTHLIPARSGHAWRVPAGSLFRLSTPQGPQVGDLNVWNAHDPRERFWAARTRQLQGSHVVEGDRLWSCLPFMRPLCGVVRDGCGLGDTGVNEEEGEGEGDGGDGRERLRRRKTKWGGRCHDLLGTRCDPYVSALLTSTPHTTPPHHCHSNLTRAILPHHLTEFDVHDVLNVFQVTGLDEQGRYFMEASPATEYSFLDFFAEQDLLCALSTCPGGDLSRWGWGEESEERQGGETLVEGEGKEDGGMKETCRPIRVEVFEIKDEVRADVLRDWKRPERSAYSGMHGMTVPVGEGL